LIFIVEYFSNRDLHAFILEGRKKMSWILVTQKMIKKEDHYMMDCVLFKELLQKKRILGY
jgi:hypothetical protein